MRVRLAPLLLALVVLSVLAHARNADASGTSPGPGTDEAPLTETERARLAAGDNVMRTQTLQIGRHRYVGGLVYIVIRAVTPGALVGLLSDPEAMREILPRTKHVQNVGMRAGDTLLELHQGNALFHASYTLRVRNEPEQNRVRFWLDRSRPHAIEDAWGFFRYEPFEGAAGPAVLLTYGILMDLGSGVVRSLYEEKLRAMTLTVPLRLREYVGRTRGASPPS